MSPDFARMMSRYSMWQNEAHIEAAAGLAPDALMQDRGAFFGSIHATANHILWADRAWLHRLSGSEAPKAANYADATKITSDWDGYVDARRKTDQALIDWADGLAPADFDGELTWYSAAMGREVTRSRAELITHVFNHQTHHRGQIHTMLTQAGAKPTDTDIPFLPDSYRDTLT